MISAKSADVRAKQPPQIEGRYAQFHERAADPTSTSPSVFLQISVPSECKGIFDVDFDVDAQVAHGILDLGMPEQNLDRSQVVGCLAPERLNGDDTAVSILATGKIDTGRIWPYVRDDRPFCGRLPPAALYYASRNRHEHPERHLKTFTGFLQADACGGYNPRFMSVAIRLR